MQVRISLNESLTAEFVVLTEEIPQRAMEAFEAQRSVLKRMNWTTEDYWEIVRLLIIRKDISVEDLTHEERTAYFEIQAGLAAAIKRMISPSQFGYLGGRRSKVPPSHHEKVREEVRDLLKQGIGRAEAYKIVGGNWNHASAATIKRICQDGPSCRVGARSSADGPEDKQDYANRP